jgi:UPF0716 protein FxsA
VLRRLPLIICAVVVLDWLFLGALFYCFGWRLPLVENIIATVIGLLAIGYYEWRWSDVVAQYLQSEPGLLDRHSLEKILLLVAGIVLLIPGILTDALGLLLLTPGVRRLIARNCHLYR